MFLVCLVSHDAHISRHSTRLLINNSVHFGLLHVFSCEEILVKLNVTDIPMFFVLIITRPTAKQQLCILATWLSLVRIHGVEIIDPTVRLGWIHSLGVHCDPNRERVITLTPLKEYIRTDQPHNSAPDPLTHRDQLLVFVFNVTHA